jgi:hypothetical protein
LGGRGGRRGGETRADPSRRELHVGYRCLSVSLSVCPLSYPLSSLFEERTSASALPRPLTPYRRRGTPGGTCSAPRPTPLSLPHDACGTLVNYPSYISRLPFGLPDLVTSRMSERPRVRLRCVIVSRRFDCVVRAQCSPMDRLSRIAGIDDLPSGIKSPKRMRRSVKRRKLALARESSRFRGATSAP